MSIDLRDPPADSAADSLRLDKLRRSGQTVTAGPGNPKRTGADASMATGSSRSRVFDLPRDLAIQTTVLGASRAMRRVLDLCQRIAPTNSTVLISGETGTGKEVVARYIHKLSPRRDHPMVVFHCAAVPETLIESELFGHERGAFTGATQPRAGLFERGNNGTLLLDEVGDIALTAQAKLLRVLQERRFSRLGSTATYESDARFIATTHQDLLAMSQRGQFREDLFYRLNVFPIHVPPLRERREDIGPLARFFLENYARQHRCKQSGISDNANAILVSYHWPGNARQLQSVIERALLLSGGEQITESHLPEEICGGFVSPSVGESASSLDYGHRLIISRALFECNWEFAKAAARLGVSSHVLRQLVARFGLKRHIESPSPRQS